MTSKGERVFQDFVYSLLQGTDEFVIATLKSYCDKLVAKNELFSWSDERWRRSRNDTICTIVAAYIQYFHPTSRLSIDGGGPLLKRFLVKVPIDDERGSFIIFNNNKFTGTQLLERTGSENDVRRLIAIANSFGIQKPTIHRDLTKEKMMETINKENSNFQATIQILFVAIMSHGDKGDKIFSRDCQRMDLYDDIIYKFCDSPHLLLKPKIFFVQACRGETEHVDIPTLRTDGQEQSSVVKRTSISNLYIFSATIPGFVTYREEKKGAWFIDALHQSIEEFIMTKSSFTLSKISEKTVSTINNITKEYNSKRIDATSRHLVPSFLQCGCENDVIFIVQ